MLDDATWDPEEMLSTLSLWATGLMEKGGSPDPVVDEVDEVAPEDPKPTEMEQPMSYSEIESRVLEHFENDEWPELIKLISNDDYNKMLDYNDASRLLSILGKGQTQKNKIFKEYRSRHPYVQTTFFFPDQLKSIILEQSSAAKSKSQDNSLLNRVLKQTMDAVGRGELSSKQERLLTLRSILNQHTDQADDLRAKAGIIKTEFAMARAEGNQSSWAEAMSAVGQGDRGKRQLATKHKRSGDQVKKEMISLAREIDRELAPKPRGSRDPKPRNKPPFPGAMMTSTGDWVTPDEWDEIEGNI
jgi:hypothetical protein